MGTDPSWQVTVHDHGTEAQPVVVIDSFAPVPGRFADDAAFLSFRQIGEHYPGVRAPVAPVLLRDLLAALAPLVRDVFGLDGLEVVDAFYSLVTTPSSALAPIQRLPHFDEVSPRRLALLHFLAGDERSGTAFYRHRATGFESVTGDRLGTYRAKLAEDIARHGMPEAGYISGDTPIYEQVAVYRGVHNRALIYRSNALHCAAIPEDMQLSDDPAQGRLTVNTFLEARS